MKRSLHCTLAIAALTLVFGGWQVSTAQAQGHTYPNYYFGTPSASYYNLGNVNDTDTYMNPNPFPAYNSPPWGRLYAQPGGHRMRSRSTRRTRRTDIRRPFRCRIRTTRTHRRTFVRIRGACSRNQRRRRRDFTGITQPPPRSATTTRGRSSTPITTARAGWHFATDGGDRQDARRRPDLRLCRAAGAPRRPFEGRAAASCFCRLWVIDLRGASIRL